MHSNLLKRYQKELKTNTSQVEQIAAITVNVLFENAGGKGGREGVPYV